MLTAFAFVDIPAPAASVWQLLGGFNSLPQWLPYVSHSALEGGGRLRRLQTIVGGIIVEQLLTFDEKAMTFSYQILETPFPVANYVSAMQVKSVSDNVRVEWSGEFNAMGIPDEDAIELIQGIYEGGLDALRQHFCEK
ncbi:hypothetical protein A5320_05925 [Rheinheimera sp. SA_1]|uniref:SRPBCC family protein n=1 Tax=Rheinheimera sp. SA_1 TaxID=1827365 RepID=UPI0007FD0EB5|nr:SRPBCC family protein [Rheinheimera sp. SA_1]OBP16892.1 hypothetical protein A5320_05925 [Rheinheimera sp. SA_1]